MFGNAILRIGWLRTKANKLFQLRSLLGIGGNLPLHH
jgi:hypothetical protein